MKRTKWVMWLIYCLVIPATLLLGSSLPGRSYYITGTLVMVELLIPFFMAFEGRKPQARELVVIAVMSTVAIVGRVAIPLPHFKAAFAVIMLAGIAFGAQSGFVVGAVCAFASNFFYGQGPYTPWQMVAYGMCGLWAGICFGRDRLPKNRWLMAVVGFFVVILAVGPILDSAGIFLVVTRLTPETILLTYASGLIYANLSLAVSTGLCMLLFGKFFLTKLERVKVKYGILCHDKRP